MKISKETITALKCLSTINPNLLLKPGNKITTISPQKNVMAEITVSEEFPEEFGIYDLGEFLGVMSLFGDADVDFNEKFATIHEGTSSIKYFAADQSILTVPTKALKFPEPEVVFNITAATLAMAIKTAGVLRSNDISFEGDGKEIRLIIADLKNPSANSFSHTLAETDLTFKANLKVENIKVLPGDYEVALAGNKISRFTNSANNAVFYVALEATSK